MRIALLKRISTYVLLIGIASCFTILQSCNESTSIGLGIGGQDEVNPALQTDTFTVKTKNIYISRDSVLTTNSTLVSIGSINNDPDLGSTYNAAYLQVNLASSPRTFESPSPTADSVVLSLSFSGLYGDSLNEQTYTVYRVTDPTFSDTTREFYTFQEFDIDEAHPLGTATVTGKGLEDSVSIMGFKAGPQLRVTLDPSLGDQILALEDSDPLKSDSLFHLWLNGLAVIPDSSSPDNSALHFFNLNNENTNLTIFYHTDKEDSLAAVFPFDPNLGSWSNYKKDNLQNSAAQNQLDQSTADSDAEIYLKSGTGLFADVEIPFLEDFDPALINKAELLITQLYDPLNATLPPPYELFLWQYLNTQKDSVGYVVDAGFTNSAFTGPQFTNLDFFDGLGKTITNEDGKKVIQYRFNIARYLQLLLTPKSKVKMTNHGFRLGIYDPQDRAQNIGRLIIGGGNHPKYPMKLRVVYTKIQ